MSLGIAFRSVWNLCEVNKKTGRVFFINESENETIQNADEVLLEYASIEKKVEDETNLRSMWKHDVVNNWFMLIIVKQASLRELAQRILARGKF